MTIEMKRRDFLRLSTGTLVSSAVLSALGGWERTFAGTADTTGYKALVCLFMTGGNDGFNWIVPQTAAAHSVYATSRSNLALDPTTLLNLTGTAGDGNVYGMHPSCPELQALFNTGKAAVLCNVGTLVQPTTPAQARSGSVAIPPQLFSHIDQAVQWQTSIPNSPKRYGWAGRVADLYASQGVTAQLAMNIDIGGSNYLQVGQSTNPYALGTNGASIMDDTSNGSYRSGLRASTASALLSQAGNDSNLMIQQYARVQVNAAQKVVMVNSAYSAVGDLTTTFPTLDQDNQLGLQLHQVARMIKARSQIGDARQIFFVNIGGFDTHQTQLTAQAQLLKIISENINAFWTAMGELGTQSNVTLFTASDFGRTLGSNGSGADHAWGNHHLIVGGAVQGGQYYGTMPSLQIGGPDDFGPAVGQIVPTTSTDQYAATLAKWFGVAAADLPTVFPNLSNFATPTLAFMG
jgi:uncharacterized protein (DUF1501 family)